MALPNSEFKNTKNLMNRETVSQRIKRRLQLNEIFKYIFLAGLVFALVVLSTLIYDIVSKGAGWVDLDFLRNFPSRRPEQAGLYPALIGSLWLMLLIVPMVFVIGVGAAIYLEEYAPKNRMTSFIEVNISNLAGVPSIVFGLLGLTIFVRVMELGNSIMAGALTLGLMSLPIVIVASQEALRAVKMELRHASLALGASKWQTTFNVVLPSALPGIITGIILAVSRAIGETAPLIMVGAATFISTTPSNIFSDFTALPIQIYNWTSRPQAEFQNLAAAGIIVLMTMLIAMNSVAIYIRNKYTNRH
ncbi:phosphate ABC transporter permease PstA [Exiguobacterium profundum]|jgi:phosphate transport system permease protein|uniref:Phosphate transport system permease protein PstA n=1 Tax=Exiguobacterium sp. (strain ATCC BAA-1283 / AT1b) TaxID=360911 RepID=C4L3J6_EXISA|nr:MULTISPECIES: phosphate ABC transporter permease PstA [Exiguobacterium]MCC9626498.1 phosphate ABC transporter permease PstA [Thalassospira sp. MA62]QPI68804.1 phosphate ABC transporter permease PstA [Exiguobacterium sp. PBE]ACQ69494.1 phosphate ABC transporter, inner membrane subunit PstA [Exiguobacterium sp. AT1b]MCT4799532.1 phosphate ABC transporter permease PstA [Exiguobacterium profundum]MCV9899578.1 phosphate ABC transporter permease PstA [Exiguobacterium sp. N5]